MSENEAGKSEPTSPRNVAADAIVSIILLAGTFVAETLKGVIPQGVPLPITIILWVSELTMLVYFVVVLVRALGYAFSELERVHNSVEGTRPWQVSKRSLSAARALLREALPTAGDFRRTLRFAVRFVTVLAVVSAGLVVLLSLERASSDGPGPAKQMRASGGAANTGARGPGSASVVEPAPSPTAESSVGEAAPAAKATIHSGLAEPPARERTPESNNSGQPSREELMRRRAELEREQTEVERLLEERSAALGGTERPRRRPRAAGGSGGGSRKSGKSGSKVSSEKRGGPPHYSEGLEPRGGQGPVFDRQAHRELSAEEREATETVRLSLGGAPSGFESSPLKAVVYGFVKWFHDYRWHLIVGAMAAALAMLFVSLFAQATRKEAA